eukprot:TRINITY_DN67807_c3_g10_i1.p1 TRINITY_DN67807_c3_g10~~TRINITY_DN67807_c3_g10_i1.p1  ORF type:complete len:589 (+),score=294.33 TRINITY_DN67807_c3_g10_i1:72-1838(+)
MMMTMMKTVLVVALVLLSSSGSAVADDCTAHTTTTGDFDDGDHGNTFAENGDLKITNENQGSFKFAWVPSTDGKIWKIDVSDGTIKAVYRSAPAGYGTNPSRTTVDGSGNVWAGNRAETSGDSGSVVYIGLSENNQCEDLNGDGVITTSTGPGDLKPWTRTDNGDGTFTDDRDECILHLFRTSATAIRHVSVDQANTGRVWVSGQHGTKGGWFDLLDGATKSIVRTEERNNNPGNAVGGYGGIVTPDNYLYGASWFINQHLNVIFPTDDPSAHLTDDDPPGTAKWYKSHASYGLCYNPLDGKVYGTFNSNIHRYDAGHQGLTEFTRTVTSGFNRGCVFDANNSMWVASSNGLYRVMNAHKCNVAPSGNDCKTERFLANTYFTGVSLDSNGRIVATAYHAKVVYFMNKDAALTDSPQYDFLTNIGAAGGGQLYTYSDFTGSTVTGAPLTGTWCENYAISEVGSDVTISWNATPNGGTVALTYAFSDDGVSFTTAQALTSSGQVVSSPTAQHVRVCSTLERTDPNDPSPEVHDITVSYTCNDDVGEESCDVSYTAGAECDQASAHSDGKCVQLCFDQDGNAGPCHFPVAP